MTSGTLSARTCHLGINPVELNLEYDVGKRRNRSCALPAVSFVVRDVNFPNAAHRHMRQSYFPAFYGRADAHFNRLARLSLYGGVENLSVNEPPFVFYFDNGRI